VHLLDQGCVGGDELLFDPLSARFVPPVITSFTAPSERKLTTARKSAVAATTSGTPLAITRLDT